MYDTTITAYSAYTPMYYYILYISTLYIAVLRYQLDTSKYVRFKS